jgi:CHASE2 domain-containing sensor protein
LKLRSRYQSLMSRAVAPWSRILVAIDPRHVYIALAVVLAAWMALTTIFDRQHRWKTSTYDWMLNHRFRVPVPDRDIVLLAIDERSLAAMAEE